MHEYEAMAAMAQQLTEAEQQIASLEQRVSDWEEKEAACCPEDYGFDEVIKALRKDNGSMEQQIAALREAIRSVLDSRDDEIDVLGSPYSMDTYMYKFWEEGVKAMWDANKRIQAPLRAALGGK